MARIGKTEEVKIIQCNYGYGWEDESTYTKDECANIKHDYHEYVLNARNYGASVRLITRRVPCEN